MNANQPTSKQALQDLMTVLAQEAHHLETVRNQLFLKQQALVQGQLESLPSIDRTLSHLGKQCGQLAHKRNQLRQALGWQQEPLSAIIAKLPPQYVPQVSQLRDRLKRLALDVEQANRENQDLLNLSLKWTQDTVAAIQQALNPNAASYNAQGGKQTTANPHPHPPTQSTISHSA